MAELSDIRPTLFDVARSQDPSGKIAKVADILFQASDILEDIPWYEGNLPTGHQMTVSRSHPAPTFRLLNQGVVPTKAIVGQLVEGCAILENRNEIDINVAKINGNTEAFRAQQVKLFIQGFMDQMATSLIYGDAGANPEQFNGLATRYFSLGTTYLTSAQMIDAGGTGSDNMSIYLVNWGEGCHGIYPKGSTAGLQIEDLGILDKLTNTSTFAAMRAYVTWFQWMCGLAIPDYRNVVRICNIDKSDLITASDGTDTSANLLKYLSQAMDLLPSNSDGGRPVFYMNQTARGMLRVKLANKGNAALSISDYMGASGLARKQLEFYGIPCRRIDALTITESRITVAT